MAHHKDLTGADLHEPKGVSGASSGQVYVANGSGSGAWTTQKIAYVTVARTITDISTAADVYVSAPVAGDIDFITAILDAAINTADAHLSFQIEGVSIDTSGITIPQTGVAGEEHNSTPTGHNTVALGDAIKISTDGASTGAAPITVTLRIRIA